MPDISYRAVVAAAKTWFKVGAVDVQMEGVESIPETGGAMLAVNHTSYVDYLMAGYPSVERGRFTRFMAKREVFDHPIGGPVMRSFKHISVDRSAGLESMEVAAEALRRGEIVGIFPEATISRSFLVKELKTGAVRIAAKAGVPVIPVVTWGCQRMFTKDHPKDFGRGKTVLVKVGEPFYPTGEDPLAETAFLRARMEELLDQCIKEYPAEEQPPGSWWLPKIYGGSAPTLEEAEQLDAEEKRKRAERKRQKAQERRTKKR